MSSLDQENLRRAEYEIRNSVGTSNEGSSATWFLGVVVIAAIVGGIYVFSADSGVTPATPDGIAPAAVDQAPATTQEAPAPTITPTE